MNSNWQRALVAVLLAACVGTGLTALAPQLHETGSIPAPQAAPETELIYSIVNLTEDMTARSACPLDLDAARARVEAGLRAHSLKPVFSPIAEGPGVLTQEVAARRLPAGSNTVCGWSANAYFNGRRGPLRRDQDGHSYSSLEAASRDVAPLLPAQVH
ncbi:hypothetical protein [Maricaulis salignorans]|uniref:Uncharacterized protein n=1 Tax=Maricaulis salignorans TaxID=144026 RepID=A0A1G9VQN8_9PROT|nr:hypothetical protein [Maricaulis salignorans]SDM74450.1 hypothetical protein SAMN04488568_12045 [Maricaulis salignorans]